MEQFPLQLERYFFTEQNISANPEFNIDTEKNPTHLEYLISYDFSKSDNSDYFISSEVRLDPEKSTNPSYFFNISVFGVISIRDKSITEDQINKILQTSGAQLIIGAIRERLAEMSSRGPWGMINLDFIPLTKSS